MTERNWTIRPLTADDFDLWRQLYAAVRGNSRPEDYDRWRLLENPVAFPPAMLAMDQDKCVGAYLLWPTRLQLGSQVVLGAQSVDTMTHPDYRNQGMFTHLAEACLHLAAERGFAALYGFPNPHSHPGFVRRLGWDHCGDVSQWVRLLRPSRLGRMPALLGGLADRAVGLWPKPVPGGLEVTCGPNLPDGADSLLEEWRQRQDLCRVARDIAWMTWRYAPAAHMDYEWVAAWRGGKLAALAAWGMRDASWGDQADGRARLVETLGTDPAALLAVLSTVLRQAEAAGAWMVETMTNVEQVTGLLRRLAFVNHRQAPLIVRGLTVATLGANIHHHPGWRFVGGDVDTF